MGSSDGLLMGEGGVSADLKSGSAKIKSCSAKIEIGTDTEIPRQSERSHEGHLTFGRKVGGPFGGR